MSKTVAKKEKRKKHPVPVRPAPWYERPDIATYELLVEAFRRMPSDRPNFKTAARYAGVEPLVAKTAWFRGWLAQPVDQEAEVGAVVIDPPMHPIEVVFERERFKARAVRSNLYRKMHASQELAAMEAEDDYANQRAIEGMACLSTMVVTSELAASLATIVRSMPSVVDSLNDDLLAMQSDESVPMAKKMLLLQQMISLTERLSLANERSLKNTRIFIGDDKPKPRAPPTVPEALASIAEVLPALRQYFNKPPALPHVLDVTPTVQVKRPEPEFAERDDLL